MQNASEDEHRTISIRQARRLDRRLAALETQRIEALKRGMTLTIWNDPPDADALTALRTRTEQTVYATLLVVELRFAIRERIDIATRNALNGRDGVGAIARDRRICELLDAALTTHRNTLNEPEAIERRVLAERAAQADSPHFGRERIETVNIGWGADDRNQALRVKRQRIEDRADHAQTTLNAIGATPGVKLITEELALLASEGIAI